MKRGKVGSGDVFAASQEVTRAKEAATEAYQLAQAAVHDILLAWDEEETVDLHPYGGDSPDDVERRKRVGERTARRVREAMGVAGEALMNHQEAYQRYLRAKGHYREVMRQYEDRMLGVKKARPSGPSGFGRVWQKIKDHPVVAAFGTGAVGLFFTWLGHVLGIAGG